MRCSRRSVWLLAGLLALGCLSPTLPLPPPTRPTIYGPDESGDVTLVGSEKPNIAVIAENLETGQIRGERTEADGRYEIVIPAQIGDQMVMYSMDRLEMSDSRYFRIPGPPPPIPGSGGGGGGVEPAQAGATTQGSAGSDAAGAGGAGGTSG